MFMTTAPFMVRFVFRLNERPYRWPTSYSFLWIASLLVTAVLGWVGTIVGLNPFYLLAVIGIGGFVLVARHFIRSRSTRESLLLLLGALIFAQWIAGVVWGRIYNNPLFHENLVATGVVHHDSLFLVALGNMLRTYGVASTGLDGLPYIPYHWGTPWLFAQWSSLLDSSLLDFYQLAYPVTIIPLFFGGAIALASEIAFSRREAHRSRLRQSWWFWGLFLAGTIGVIPIQAMDALGVYTSALVISESYAVAVSVGLLMVGATAAFWAGGASERLM